MRFWDFGRFSIVFGAVARPGLGHFCEHFWKIYHTRIFLDELKRLQYHEFFARCGNFPFNIKRRKRGEKKSLRSAAVDADLGQSKPSCLLACTYLMHMQIYKQKPTREKEQRVCAATGVCKAQTSRGV